MGNGCTSQKSVSLVHLNKYSIPTFKIILVGDSGVGKTSISSRLRKQLFQGNCSPTKNVVIDNVVKKVNVPNNAVVSMAIWDIPSREEIDMGKTYYHNVDAVLVVVDMSERDSIELAGVWRQDFVNKASRSREVRQTLPNGTSLITLQPDKLFDPRTVPIILLGNKFDLEDHETEADEARSHVDEFLSEKTENEENIKDVSVQENNDENSAEDTTKEKPSDNFSPLGLLQETEKRYKFTASIPVSAKLKDGSVDEAFQALLRHLLDRDQVTWPSVTNVQKDTNTRKLKRHHPDFEVQFEKLSETGINQLDEIYHRCNAPMKRCQRYQKLYDGCLKRFMLRCVELGLLSDTSADLQQCMAALKGYIQTRMARSLLVKEDGDFVKIYYDYDDSEDNILLKQQRVFNRLLDKFHKEFGAVCKGVIQETPALSSKLLKLQNRLTGVIQELQENNAQDETNTYWLGITENNNSRIDSCIQLLKDTLQAVDSAKIVIQSALQ